jgi:hypothetical protein
MASHPSHVQRHPGLQIINDLTEGWLWHLIQWHRVVILHHHMTYQGFCLCLAGSSLIVVFRSSSENLQSFMTELWYDGLCILWELFAGDGWFDKSYGDVISLLCAIFRFTFNRFQLSSRCCPWNNRKLRSCRTRSVFTTKRQPVTRPIQYRVASDIYRYLNFNVSPIHIDILVLVSHGNILIF